MQRGSTNIAKMHFLDGKYILVYLLQKHFLAKNEGLWNGVVGFKGSSSAKIHELCEHLKELVSN